MSDTEAFDCDEWIRKNLRPSPEAKGMAYNTVAKV